MPGTSGRTGGDRSRRVDRTQPDSGPARPSGRSEAFNTKWDELLGQLPAAVLRGIDSHQIALLVAMLVDADTQALRLEADPCDLKTRRVFLGTVQSIGRMSAQFGLSPSDRQRLKIEPEKEPDAFTEWMSERMGRAGGGRNSGGFDGVDEWEDQ